MSKMPKRVVAAVGGVAVDDVPQANGQLIDEAAAVVIEAQAIERTITQDGIARVFARRFSGQLRYCHHANRWYQWVGTHWRRDDTDIAFEYVRRLGREITEKGEIKDLKEVRKTSFATGVEKFARSDPAFAVTSEAWDKHPYLLGTPEGTIDLRSGLLRPSDPQEGITKVAAIAPARSAQCPTWIRFLRETTAGDLELIRFLKQWSGYCLTGEINEHALVFGYGPGGNGKTVFLNTIVGILNDYAVNAPADTFTASFGDRHPTELAMLRGARLVAASETEQGRTWAESRIKQLTGGDPVTARFMRGDFFTYAPEFKLMIVGNHQPTLVNVDDATRRRFNIVPFVHRPERPDLFLGDRLRAEWPGILRWMIEGCLDWQKHKLVRPQCVLDATADYFDDQDLFGQWLATSCECQPRNEQSRLVESTADLYRDWTSFAAQAREKAGSQRQFSMTLQKRGFFKSRTGQSRQFRGIRLLQSDEPRCDT